MKKNIIKNSLFFGVLIFISFIVTYQYILDCSLKESFYLSLPVALLTSVTWGVISYYLKKKQM